MVKAELPGRAEVGLMGVPTHVPKLCKMRCHNGEMRGMKKGLKQ